jgi:hypothetical protein
MNERIALLAIMILATMTQVISGLALLRWIK